MATTGTSTSSTTHAKSQTSHSISRVGGFGNLAGSAAAGLTTSSSAALPQLRHRDLSYGMSGSDVKMLQMALNHFLLPSPCLMVDGIFGYKTELAVVRFQSGCNLTADGIAGHQTWDAIDKAAGKHHVDGKQQQHQQQHLDHKPVISHGVGGSTGSVLVRRAGKLVPHYWQSDPKWGGCSVGGGRNMACIGCGVTAIAMFLRYYGRNVDPGTLNDWLYRNGGYSGSCVIWSQVFRAFENQGQRLVLHNHMFTDRSKFRSILYNRIDKGVPTIVDVDYGRDADSIGNHYVVVVGRTADGGLLMNDPAAAAGNGAMHPASQNVIEHTTRGGGYNIVSLCLVNPA